MKRIVLGIIFAALWVARVEATLAPGTPTGFMSGSTPPFLLLAPQGDGSFSTPLPFSVVPGDVVMLQSSTGGIGTSNWREVLSFSDVGGHGMATINVMQNYAGFVLAGQKTGEIEYVLESSGNSITVYTPGAESLSPQTASSSPDHSYFLTDHVTTAVPEASTWVAGVLLLFPLGLSVFRLTRKAQIL
jgi:hypothetical protein